MSECTERSEGRERMTEGIVMSECTERSEGRERMTEGIVMSECTEGRERTGTTTTAGEVHQ